MEFKQVTITHAGIELDTFSDSEGNCYITTGSIAKGLGRTRQSVEAFFKAYPEQDKDQVVVTITTGRMFSAYPVDTVTKMFAYWAKLGHKPSFALLEASAKDDLLNRVEEAHGLDKSVELRFDYDKAITEAMALPLNEPDLPVKSDVLNLASALRYVYKIV